MFLSDNSRSGMTAFSSETSSPNWVDDSSPTGESSEAGRMAARRMSATLAGGTPSARPSSRLVGSRPSLSSRLSRSRRIREIFSTKCTGSRMILPWLAKPRLIDCLIHHEL